MIKITSLFTGMGGMDLGFHYHPEYKIVFANDFMKEACNTYAVNFNNPTYLHQGPLERCMDYIPPHDLLLFGFPCQPFTIAGKRMGFEDMRSSVFYNAMTVLAVHQPRYFFAENVKGLITHDSGNSLREVLRSMSDVGYDVHYSIIKMEKHGIPQTRHRVIFFGVHKSIGDLTIAKGVLDLPEFTPKLLSEVLLDVSKECTLGSGNHNLHTATEAKQHWMQVLNEGENISSLTKTEIAFRVNDQGLAYREKPKTSQGYKRLSGNKVAPTMMFGNTCLPIHPTENRSLSVREAAAVQTFPLDFEIKGGIAAQYKQVGNAVPPKLSQMLAENLFEFDSTVY